MNKAKRISQWLVGIVVGLYLAVTLLVNIPFVQRWMADGVSSVLEDIVGTNVDIGRVEPDWNGRLIITDLAVDDQKGQEMLRVARLAARISLRDIIHRRIRIGNAQIFGLHANLYQECPQCDPNFKFLIDAFASKDTTTHTPLDLRISQLLVRRGNIRWQQPYADGLTSNLDIRDLNLTARLGCLTDDSIALRIKRLDFREETNKLNVSEMSFFVEANKQAAQLSDFELKMPGSNLAIPSLTARYTLGQGKPKLNHLLGSLKARLSPTDFVALVPRLAELDDVAIVSAHFETNDDRLTLSSLHLQDEGGQLRLAANGWADALLQGKDSLRAMLNVEDLYAESALFAPYLPTGNKVGTILNKLSSVRAKGKVAYNRGEMKGELTAKSPMGDIMLSGNGHTNGRVDANLKAQALQLGELLEEKDLGLVSLDVKAKGHISKSPTLSLSGRIPELDYKGYRYRNIEIDDAQIRPTSYAVRLSSGDPNASFTVDADADLARHTYDVKADITRLAPNTLNLTDRYVGTQFAGTLFASLTGTNLSNLDGVVQLNDLAMTDSTGTYRPGDLHLTSRPRNNVRHLVFISPFLEAQVEGDFDPRVVVSQINRMVSNYLPTRGNEPLAVNKDSGRKQEATDAQTPLQQGHASFILRAYNATPLNRLLGIPLTLNGTTTAQGEIDSERNAMWMNLTAASLQYGNEQLRNIDMQLESNYKSMLVNLGLQRMMKSRWINVGLQTQGDDGKLTTRLFFDNNANGFEKPSSTYAGDLSIESRLWQDSDGKQGFEGRILPSNFIISDTLWAVHPGHVSYYDGALQVDSFRVSQGNRFISVEGRASKLESDTLHAKLQRINLEYIFSLVNFHAVELTGEATGEAYGHSLFSQPKADAFIHIPQFALNYGRLGDLDIHINWGDRPYSILLDGNIKGDMLAAQNDTLPRIPITKVQGYITPKKDIDYHGLDLNVNADHVNLEFINMWTSVIFDNLQGKATGWARIFGPFKQINIEGDVVVNEGSLGVPYIGTRYHLINDTVRLRPDNIYFTNAILYDPQGNPGIRGHQALATGHLHHNGFKDMSYDISIKGDNILGYNFTDFGDQNFYGTVYATGEITLKGQPGETNIAIKARPERGTTFTYNATSPDKLTDTPFIAYKKREDWTMAGGDKKKEEDPELEAEDIATNNDMHIDFDLDIDEQSTMNLLMDVRSGDKITLNGNGHMLAHYYNKGSFDLYGTYRVSRGTYNLSLQEVIRKNFEFSPDGTITFNGEPYAADLNLQAVHTVTGVSLNDINPRANFSNTTTRVNCLMNIGGKAREPRITFDFDIPNANDEEKQMVRSLISTDEERNMQVIYLLGIGRFYAYDYANTDQTQGTTAMNSLLASTLSGSINQALSSMLGKTNWNFGANLRTGQDGWNDMDVEGILQGSLLNNRLLINGNFGYRDTPVANSNFIGDFDVKYLLTRSGSVALKAYSETNDRYFTKTSLTTQGLGVLLKKDFTSWKDLVIKRKRKKKN